MTDNMDKCTDANAYRYLDAVLELAECQHFLDYVKYYLSQETLTDFPSETDSTSYPTGCTYQMHTDGTNKVSVRFNANQYDNSHTTGNENIMRVCFATTPCEPMPPQSPP